MLEGLSFTIGWQFRPDRGGGPVFVLLRRGAFGLKALERFPLSEVGWANAWQALVKQSPQAAEKIRMQLTKREREQR